MEISYSVIWSFFAGNPQQDVFLTKLFSYLVQPLFKSACMTEFASYVKVLVRFQRGMMTTGVESQHSTPACAVLSHKFNLMCVAVELARSAMGSFISPWNITAVRSALENWVFLCVLFRYVRCKLGITSVGNKPPDMVPLTSFKLRLGLQAMLKCISVPHPSVLSISTSQPGHGEWWFTASGRSEIHFSYAFANQNHNAFRTALSSQGMALLC